MVRLVFRPYTRVRRAICTSAPLRASTRVSSGFALPRHSSPSFGSYHICSRSDLQSTIVCRLKLTILKIKFVAFTAPSGFKTLRLADVLHSLVRVSRRVVSRLYPSVFNLIKGIPLSAAVQLPPPKRKHTLGRAQRHRLHRSLTRWTATRPTTSTAIRFHRNGFRFFSPSFQSACQLSLTVLVHYRSTTSI